LFLHFFSTTEQKKKHGRGPIHHLLHRFPLLFFPKQKTIKKKNQRTGASIPQKLISRTSTNPKVRYFHCFSETH
jgi:hypothetical protein